MTSAPITLNRARAALLVAVCAFAALLTSAAVARAAEFGDNFGLAPGSVWAGTCHLPSLGAPPYNVPPYSTNPELAIQARDCHRSSTLQPQTAIPATGAGEHPDATTTFEFNSVPPGTFFGPGGFTELVPPYPEGSAKDVFVELPPGVIGNPQAVPTCKQTLWQLGQCPIDSQVGTIELRNSNDIFNPQNCGGPNSGEFPQFAFPSTALFPSGEFRCRFPLYDLTASYGQTAAIGFAFFPGINIYLEPTVRTDGDDGLRLAVRNIPQTPALGLSTATIWGVPGDPSHDAFRFNAKGLAGDEPGQPWPASTPVKPFLTNPTNCDGTEPQTKIVTDSWQHPGTYLPNGAPDLADPNWHVETIDSPPITGCNAVGFSPTLRARPTTTVADSPSGLEFDLQIPQNEDPSGVAEAHLKDTKLVLPEGLVVNPSAANGLDACTSAQIGLTTPVGDSSQIRFDKNDPTCPDASKLGTAQVTTPLLAEPLEGTVYLAKQSDNPFGSLLALYLVLQSPQRGLTIKLAGDVQPDPRTGQLTATFEENPQLPFSDLKLNFRQGAGAPLRTPPACGTYSTASELTPWSAPDSGPPAKPSDTYSINSGPGGNCAASPGTQPNSPSFDAGSTGLIAGAASPLVINLRREDGTQQFSSLTLTPPEGLLGKLAGIPYCSDAALKEAESKSGRQEEANQSCPQASYVGSVTIAAGAGPTPYYASGKAYLTGPYKGAPISLAIVTPATAGPFDLGTVVVRTALQIDRRTAQITAVSDPIPTILQGIPLDIRSVQVRLDRPDFTLNPTSCDPASFGGQLTSAFGDTASLQSHFQVAECGRLGFKPNVKLSLKGSTKRNGNPALTAVLTMPPGGANLSNISVALPHSEFLEQGHIRTVCTRVQFAAHACPAASIYGTATVTTPLLDYPLTGPVYLRSSSNKLPDLVPDLIGPANQPIELEADGRIDSIHGGIRNTFDFVPDAPFTRFVLKMQGGKKSLLANSRDICKYPSRATVTYGGHNGATYRTRPLLQAQCPKGKTKKGKGKKSHHKSHKNR